MSPCPAQWLQELNLSDTARAVAYILLLRVWIALRLNVFYMHLFKVFVIVVFAIEATPFVPRRSPREQKFGTKPFAMRRVV